jgi:hypothetical protein
MLFVYAVRGGGDEVTQVETLESFSEAMASCCPVPLLPASSLVKDDWASWGALHLCKA